MVDSIDLAQTIALFAALVFSGIEVRGRRRELKMQNYLNANTSFAQTMEVLLDHEPLHRIYDKDEKTKDLEGDALQQAHYCDWIISLCETVYIAQRDGLIDEGEWPYWRDWLVWFNEVSTSFQRAWKWVGGSAPASKVRSREYDGDFLEIVNQKMKGKDFRPDSLWRRFQLRRVLDNEKKQGRRGKSKRSRTS